MFPCEGCGADLRFDIGVQNLKCPYCGYIKQIELPEEAEIAEQDFHEMLARLRQLHEQRDTQDHSGEQEVRCDSCGGTVLFVGSLTSTECPYCASPVQLSDIEQAKQRIPVDGVLPFLVDRNQARANLAAWVKSRWFAPNDFKRRGIEGKFNGVYLPYWTFDSHTATRYSGQRGEHYYVTVGSGKNRRRVRRTRWYPASGQFQRFFDDVMVLATGGMRRDMMEKLEPWPLAQCAPYNQQMLAGYLARTYEIDLEPGFAHARKRIEDALLQDVRQRIGGDTQRVHSVQTRHSAVSFKHLLLPTWLMSYRYREKPYQVMINAATGEVHGERPYSGIKITLAVLAGLVAAGGLWYMFAMQG